MNPPPRKLAYIKAFPKGIREKVRKLLYHSLRTNVVEGKGNKPLSSHKTNNA